MLSPLLQNAIHITCFSHIFNLVIEQFKIFESVNDFVKGMRKLFRHDSLRNNEFIEKFNFSCPSPNQTRWNNFLIACKKHYSVYDQYKDFINSIKNPPKEQSKYLKRLKEIVVTPKKLEDKAVPYQLKFIANLTDSLIGAVKRTQESNVQIHFILSDSKHLMQELKDSKELIDKIKGKSLNNHVNNL